MAVRVKIDQAGLTRAMRSDGARTTARSRAEDVATAARAMNIQVGASDGGGDVALPVVVEETPGLTGAAVVIAHPSGEAVQAKHGVLTKAALRAGLKLGDA